MIPFRDENPSLTVPFITVAIIGINIAVFVFSVIGGLGPITILFGAYPVALVTHMTDQPISPFATVFTSMFIHAGLLHIAGNMLYMWIFGDNVEDRMGHARFIVFYLTGGVVAAYSHAFFNGGSTLPMVGASGAISAVLGAYLYMFPRAKVDTLVFFGFFVQVIQLPALIVIGFWAIIQFISGMLAGEAGGVAWLAHIGGFLYGLVTARIFLIGRRRTAWS